MDWQTFTLTIGGGIVLAFAAWNRHIMAQKHQEHTEMWNAVNAIRADQAAFKLQVAREFASTEHLKEVEQRLVKALEGIDSKMDNLVEHFQQFLIMATKGSK